MDNTQPNQNTNTPLLPYEEVKSMTEEDYDKYFSQKLTGFNESGISGYVGPMFLRFVPFPTNSFAMEASMAPVPNLIDADTNFYHSFNIGISEVLDSNNYDILDHNDNKGEYHKERKQPMLRFHYLLLPFPQIYFEPDAIFTVIPSKKIEDIVQIKGTICFSLPINMQKLILTEKDKGIEIKQGKATWKIKIFEPKKIEIEVTEEVRNGVKIVNHNIIDHVLFFPKGWKADSIATYFYYSASFSSKNHNFTGIENQTFVFDEPDQPPIDHIDLILYDGPVLKSYDFTLTKHVDNL